MTFELEVTDSSRLIDAEPRLMPCVVAKPVSELKLQMDEGKQESEENMLMRAIAANRNSSIANLAVTCGFVGATGQPQKSKVHRLCGRLVEEKLLERRGNKYRITPKGKQEIGWSDDSKNEWRIDDAERVLSLQPMLGPVICCSVPMSLSIPSSCFCAQTCGRCRRSHRGTGERTA